MAQSYTTDDGITLYDPGTVVSTQVISKQTGAIAAGVVTLVGEANEGPAWSKEADLDNNSFAPDELDSVMAKYGSGRLVDAFRAVIAASNDPAIVGSVQAVKIVKTNDSTAASATLSRSGFGTYATLTARREGAPGNMIRYKSEIAQSEVAPTTGLFAFAPLKTGTTTFGLRTNGSSKKTVIVPALTAAPALVSLVEDVSLGLLCQGGEQQLPLTGQSGNTVSCTAPSSTTLIVTLASGQLFNPAPEIGDTVVIPLNGEYSAAADSVLKGAANANSGSYVVTNVTNTLSSASLTLKAANIVGPVCVSASGSVDAGELDLIVFKKLQISNMTGMDRQVADGLTVNWACTLNDGTNIVLGITTSSTSWVAQPKVGDIMTLSAAFAGIASGFYMVTASTSTTVSAARLSSGTAGTTGTETGVAAGFTILKPVIDGLGKSLEVSASVAAIFKNAAGAAVTFSNSLILSSSEYINLATIAKGNSSSAVQSGSDIVLKVGSTAVGSTIVIDTEKVQVKVGSTIKLTAMFAQVSTLADLIGMINSISGYAAAIGATKFSSLPLSSLDRGTFKLEANSTAFMPARIKKDAYDWTAKVGQSSFAANILVAQSGLPEEIAPFQYLSGGAKNGSTGLQVSDAISACAYVDTNFIVPLFSVDSSDDILTGDTESTSTYTIDAINALVKNHCIEASALKAKRNRVGMCSKKADYLADEDAAGELASFRTCLCIQDVKLVGSDGQIHQYQPWMASVIAAGMQAAAGFKGIVKKFANISGLIFAGTGFNSKSTGDREKALKAGLLFMESVNTGGFRWVSDQTSYTYDNNFVFNSLQAVYLSDLMALVLISEFDRAIVGKSVAEVSAAAALAFLQLQMTNFYRLRWITASDDAPLGYKSAVVKINGGVLKISVEVKLAGLIYFVPITLAISEVTQTATA